MDVVNFLLFLLHTTERVCTHYLQLWHTSMWGLVGKGINLRRCGFVYEREREIHYVQWASKAYEDESMFMSEAHLGWQ